MKNKPDQTGLSLIEIMIALLISVFLLGGVLQIFLGSKQTYRMQEALSRLQENGRFALDFLAKDIRMAGFLGCNSQATLINKLKTLAGTDNYFLYHSFDKAIEGFESTSTTAWSPAINAAITSPLGGSDIITIRRADDQSFTVTTHVVDTAANTSALTLDATATTANLQSARFLTSASPPANHCAIAIVSDCSAAAIFQVSAVAGSVLSNNTGATGTGGMACEPDNLTNDLGKTYVNGQVYPINTISFFVRNNPLTGSNQKPSLYRRIDSNGAEELVEGIENMQILYGVDTDMPFNGPNYYVSADKVTNADWPKVVSTRITLTVRTIDGNLTTTGDGRIRRNFTSTIALRNRLP